MTVNKKELAALIDDLHGVLRESPPAYQELLEELRKLPEEASERTPSIIIEIKALRSAQKFANRIGKRIEGGSTF